MENLWNNFEFNKKFQKILFDFFKLWDFPHFCVNKIYFWVKGSMRSKIKTLVHDYGRREKRKNKKEKTKLGEKKKEIRRREN